MHPLDTGSKSIRNFVNGKVESDRFDLIQPYHEMGTTEREYDNHNLSSILANHSVIAAKTSLQSRRFRNEMESMCSYIRTIMSLLNALCTIEV